MISWKIAFVDSAILFKDLGFKNPSVVVVVAVVVAIILSPTTENIL